MKASRFSDAQKAFILKQGKDGMPVAEICRKAGDVLPEIPAIPSEDGHAQEQIYQRAGHQGAEGARCRIVGQRRLPEARHQRRDLLQVAISLRRDGDLPREQAEGVRRSEPQAQNAAGEDDARCVDAEGDAGKMLLTPSLRRRAVTWTIKEKSYSQRRACALVGLHPKTIVTPQRGRTMSLCVPS